jgi:hypothetical protein
VAKRLEGEDLRREIRELLVPDGTLIGDPGRRRGVRVVQGGLRVAGELMGELEALGEPTHKEDYDGRMVQLSEEGAVGLRRRSKSGEPTMDVQVQWVSEIRKVKFV